MPGREMVLPNSTFSHLCTQEDRHVKIETMPVLEQKTGPLYPEILAIMRRYNLNVASAFQCGKMTMAVRGYLLRSIADSRSTIANDS
jgi:hypothetical protein